VGAAARYEYGSRPPCSLESQFAPSTINSVTGKSNFLSLPLAEGAVCPGFAISPFIGMSVERTSIAVAIYLATQVGMSFLLQTMS